MHPGQLEICPGRPPPKSRGVRSGLFHPLDLFSRASMVAIFTQHWCYAIPLRSHTIINEFVQYCFNIKNSILSTFQYSQDIHDIDSYKRLLWQQYLMDINVKYIFGGRNEIHTHQIHNTECSDQYFKKCRVVVQNTLTPT